MALPEGYLLIWENLVEMKYLYINQIVGFIVECQWLARSDISTNPGGVDIYFDNVAAWVDQGLLRFSEHIVDGFDNNRRLTGCCFPGKIVRLNADCDTP